MKDKSPALGVIVGRFHVHTLHDGHLDLIERVIAKHYRVLVVLGLAPVKNTIKNPLDFEARKQMILERFPSVTVLYQKDVASDAVWSKGLDELVSDMITEQGAVLYGSRDSFIEHYLGRFPTEILESVTFTSGTEVRKMISNYPRTSPDFRAGVIWSAFNRFPTSFQCVDIAIVDDERILLGKKKHEDGYRFVGGFVSPTDDSLEDAAQRECTEEVKGITFSSPFTYIGSFRIDDWRYRNENDKIMTALFMVNFKGGVPEAADDIEEVRWFNISDDIKMMPNHEVLLKKTRQFLGFNSIKNPPAAGPLIRHADPVQNDLH